MSTSSRRAKRAASQLVITRTPELAPRVLPEPFFDEDDLGPPESQEGYRSRGESSWSFSRLKPYYRAAPVRLPTRPQIVVKVVRGVGPPRISSRSSAAAYPLRSTTPPSYRRGSLFSLQTPSPGSTNYCIRRKQRKEVLFALRSKGVINRRSPGAGGTYRRNYLSQWRC